MKYVMNFCFMVGLCLLSCISFAECTTNRNVNIAIEKPDSIYIDHGDGTITDTQTGLMWDKCQLGRSGSNCAAGTLSSVTWKGAFDAVNSANASTYLGYSDWRLPGVMELGTLVDQACNYPAINETLFPATDASWHWTGTPYLNGSTYAWITSFHDGNDNISSVKSTLLTVRFVRGAD